MTGYGKLKYCRLITFLVMIGMRPFVLVWGALLISFTGELTWGVIWRTSRPNLHSSMLNANGPGYFTVLLKLQLRIQIQWAFPLLCNFKFYSSIYLVLASFLESVFHLVLGPSIF